MSSLHLFRSVLAPAIKPWYASVGVHMILRRTEMCSRIVGLEQFMPSANTKQRKAVLTAPPACMRMSYGMGS